MGMVLVVDDTPSVRSSLARIVRRAGYEVLCTASGEEALVEARRHDLVAAVVDYQMPGMDGLTLLAKLRTVRPDSARILFSGALDMDVVMEAVNRGEVSRVLPKPISAAHLVAALDQAVARRDVVGEAWLASRDATSRSRRAALDEVIEGRELDLALQPIVDPTTRRAVAFEALVRPRGLVFGGPEPLIRAAEEFGRVGELGGAVAASAEHWLAYLPEPVSLFVNMHPAELRDPMALLDAYAPLHPYASRVVLEITERGPIESYEDWHRSVSELRAKGFRIAVDDLGAGAASLSVLAEVDPDVVKLDMSLVRGVDASPRKRRLIQTLCRFARAGGGQVVAEGIETAREGGALIDLGVDLLQGYWMGRPQLATLEVDHYVDSVLPASAASRRSGTRRRRGAEGVVDLAEVRREKAGR